MLNTVPLPGGRTRLCVVTDRRPARRLPGGTAGTARPGPGQPVRLTRRGRVVARAASVLAVLAAAAVAWASAAGGVQASGRNGGGGPAPGGHRGMVEVVVRPGQTLWSIAATAEPEADTRVVVQEIMTGNALSSPLIMPGQTLWVPRG